MTLSRTNSNDETEYLSILQAARKLNVSPGHIRNAIYQGHLKASRLPGKGLGTYRIARSHLEEYLEAAAVQPRARIKTPNPREVGRRFRELDADRLLDAWNAEDN